MSSAGSGAGPSPHYGMNYVDGAKGSAGSGSTSKFVDVSCLLTKCNSLQDMAIHRPRRAPPQQENRKFL
jgi:hypothetical protein